MYEIEEIENHYVHSKQKRFLTLFELRELWKMYNGDCSLSTIALYMRISKEYALECIEAAKMLYGDKTPKKAYKPPVIVYNEELDIISKQFVRARKKEEAVYFKSNKPPQKMVRPPAIYTNSTPYGIAQQYNK